MWLFDLQRIWSITPFVRLLEKESTVKYLNKSLMSVFVYHSLPLAPQLVDNEESVSVVQNLNNPQAYYGQSWRFYFYFV